MTPLENSKVLVTGISGFLGSHIAKRLVANGVEVTGVDIQNANDPSRSLPSSVRIVEGDIGKSETLRGIGKTFDFVVHMAALAMPRACDENPKDAFYNNVLGTYYALRFALDSGAKKFIFPSTAHVYGISPKYVPTDETHPLALQSVYTTTKILGENLCRLFNSNHHLPYTVLRLYNVYGPGQSTDYFVPAMIAKARTGLVNLEGGNIVKDFVYVDDLVEIVLKSIQSEFVGELNVGSGKQTSLETVASYVAKSFGAKLKSEPSRDPNQATKMQSDPTRARKVLGWECKVPLEEGLKRTLGWARRTDSARSV